MAGDYFGWDIGGVHLKLSIFSTGGGAGPSIRTRIVPFEIWKEPAGLADRLRSMRNGTARSGGAPVVAHGVTMTAELSDIYPTRAEGVRLILAACGEALGAASPGGAPLRVLDLRGSFVSEEEALQAPQEVAAANWMATARLVSLLLPEGILIDVGSTTTDIVPIREGRPDPLGRTDTERLMSGELLYAGLLRTPPSSLTGAVPLRGGWCRVATERFAISADVYRLLGRIDETDYTVPTPDGRGKTPDDSAARLARVVCSEPSALGRAGVEAIAAYLERRQVAGMVEAIGQVLSRRPPSPGTKAVAAGVGAFLALEAASQAGLVPAPLSDLLPEIRGAGWDRAAPSAAIALLLAEESGALRLGLTGRAP